MTEVPPLFVVEFLHRVVDTFEDYFGECSEAIIKVHMLAGLGEGSSNTRYEKSLFYSYIAVNYNISGQLRCCV